MTVDDIRWFWYQVQQLPWPDIQNPQLLTNLQETSWPAINARRSIQYVLLFFRRDNQNAPNTAKNIAGERNNIGVVGFLISDSHPGSVTILRICPKKVPCDLFSAAAAVRSTDLQDIQPIFHRQRSIA
jgi:hypothetical protein